jgi:putative N-acetylmannosamine-6-phosphate epimerase
MSDDSHHEDDNDHGEGRVTSPMQDYTTAHVGFGAVVLVVGLALTFGLGLLL